MRSILRRIVVFVATLSLGGVAIAQSTQQDAFARGGQDKQQQTQQTQQQQQQQRQAQNQQMSLKQKAQYVESWASNESVAQADEYSSDGFQLLYSAFDDVSQQLEQQPIGGGPADAQAQQQQQQQRQQIQQALQRIRSEHQQLQQTAGELSDNQDLMQHPRQFQQGAMNVVNILDSLQQARFSEVSDDVQQVRQSVEQIDVNQPLAAQQDTVQNFFVQSSQVLNQIADQIEQEQGAVGGGPADDQQKQQKQQKNQQQQQ